MTKSLFKSFVGTQSSRIKNNGIIFKNKNLMMHEYWNLSTPPMDSDVGFGKEIDIAGMPTYFQILKNLGLKKDGFGIVYDYPGGVEKYFEDITKKNIDVYCASLSFNPLTFTGQITIDIEVAFPAVNEGTLVFNLAAQNFIVYMDAKHGIKKEHSMRLYNGICAQYYPIVIQYLRKKFPKAKIGWYDTPCLGPHSTWYSDNKNQIEAIQSLIDSDCRWLFTMIDMLTPGLYMYYDLEKTWTEAGQTTYDDWHNARDLYYKYTTELKKKFGLPIYPTVCPVYVGDAGKMLNKPLEPDDWDMVMQMLTMCEADGAIVWANAVNDEDVKNANDGLIAGAKLLNNFRLS